MSAIINGDSPSITFSDATTQATSAVVSGKVPYSILPTGSVLQVVQGILNTSASTTSATFVSTGLTATITPKFSTSKILITISASMGLSNSSPDSLFATIFRNSTNLWNGNTQGFVDMYSPDNLYCSASVNYLDSPSTTSATTYTFYYLSNSGGIMRINPNVQLSTITLMEIAG